MTTTVCQEADRITNGDRKDVYGHPSVNFGNIAKLWSTYLQKEITAEQVAVCMILVKVERLRHAPGHRDSIVDIAGYANCMGMMLDATRGAHAGEHAGEYAGEEVAEWDIEAGDCVILGRHEEVKGVKNWTSEMDTYVGTRAVVSSVGGRDSSGCEIVSVMGNNYLWRVRNLRRISRAGGSHARQA